jgi:BirA family biotin operon repressor/biotin-[acetyl-CoA-carboxylase] ligase
MEARNAFFLSMAVSLSLKDACLPVCPSLSLKWPNDLYAGSKKCGGILIQTAIADARIQYAVIGIGLNVNQVAFGAHLPNATSLALESGRPVDRNALATQLFESLESRYRQLKNGSFQEIRQAYLRNLHGLNQPQTFTRLDNHRLFEGVIRGVTTEGKLEIETPAGCQLFAPKEIRQHMLPE